MSRGGFSNIFFSPENVHHFAFPPPWLEMGCRGSSKKMCRPLAFEYTHLLQPMTKLRAGKMWKLNLSRTACIYKYLFGPVVQLGGVQCQLLQRHEDEIHALRKVRRKQVLRGAIGAQRSNYYSKFADKVNCRGNFAPKKGGNVLSVQNNWMTTNIHASRDKKEFLDAVASR